MNRNRKFCFSFTINRAAILRLTSILNRKRSHVSWPIKCKTAQGSAFIRETAGEALSLLVELVIRHKCDNKKKDARAFIPLAALFIPPNYLTNTALVLMLKRPVTVDTSAQDGKTGRAPLRESLPRMH